MSSGKPDSEGQAGCQSPSPSGEVGLRLKAAINLFQTKKEAADTLGVSTDQLARYLKEIASPPLNVLARLAQAKNVRLDWLATGVGPMLQGGEPALSVPETDSAAIAPDLYGRVLEAISNVYKELGWGITLRQLGAEASRIATEIAADGLAPEEVPVAVRTAAAMLRRQLREAQANPGTGNSLKDRA